MRVSVCKLLVEWVLLLQVKMRGRADWEKLLAQEEQQVYRGSCQLASEVGEKKGYNGISSYFL